MNGEDILINLRDSAETIGLNTLLDTIYNMKEGAVVKTIVLEELANGNGQRADEVLKNLGQLDLLGVDSKRYKSAVFELFNSTLTGMTKADAESSQSLMMLAHSLVNITNRMGVEVYEFLFLPLIANEKEDLISSVGVIQSGAKILAIRDGTEKFPGMDVDSFVSMAKTVLFFIAKNKTPETRSRAVEVLSNFGEPEVKKKLDEMLRGSDNWVKKIAEESIAIIRAREDFREALNHEKTFMKFYPYEGHPKRYFVSAVYGSMKTLMADTNEAKIPDTAESASAVRHLMSLAKSSSQWEEVFEDNPVEAEILRHDLQNVLFHFIKRGDNASLRNEAAAVLAEHGDKRATYIMDRIVKREERGAEVIRNVVPPKNQPQQTPKKKAVAC